MKNFFAILFLSLSSFTVFAQAYNNEWIDFSKTYYKFNLGSNGLCRIPQTTLANAGLGNIAAQNFQLFRNGQEVPIYTSVSSGILGPNDYIEFWGQANDGKTDKQLYRNPAYQLTDKWSLQTDTAIYFLTVNPSGTAFHFTSKANDTTGNVLPVEPFFMHTSGTYFKSQLNPGYAQIVGEYIYSSAYDMGEFWSSDFANPGSTSSSPNPVVDNQNNLFAFSGGPNATIRFGAAGCTDTLRNIQVQVNGSIVKDTAINRFNDLLTSAGFPTALLNSGSANVQFFNNTQQVILPNNDRLVVSFYELIYPRQFNFGGQANFGFVLPAKLSGYYLRISNFVAGGAVPVLYDVTSRERYPALVEAGNILSFVLPGSVSIRTLVLVSEDPSNIKTITGLTAKNFINFNDPANQGNYIIISNPQLYTGSNGRNPVIDYKNYRSSLAGGGYNAQVVDINELVDQFAFGIKKHPSSVKNFLNYARANYISKPAFVFLIGRGMAYNDYRFNESNSADDLLNPVPTFGFPASDMMLSSADGAHAVPLTPIGRVAAVNGTEVENYLEKVIEYEQAQQTSPNTLAARDWMKTVVHVTGATDPFLEAVLCTYMMGYMQVIKDTFYGANVTTFCSTNSVNGQGVEVSNQLLSQIFNNGISLLVYFGHSSASSLGFNLDDPNTYSNQGKYPVFYVNGCYAGNFFVFDVGRLSLSKTLSENYVLAKQRGSIAFVASTHFGIVNYLNVLLNGLYARISKSDYGKPIGVIQLDAAQDLINVAPGDYLARLHAEEMTLHGDPALKINGESLPDYVVEPSLVKISPAFISVADNNFKVNARFVNIGKAVSDSISILITRRYPDGSSTTLLRKRIPGIRYSDSVQISVPIIATRDKGKNTITVTVNSDFNVPEVTTANNTISTDVFIYQDELTPIYPFNYAIVNASVQKLYASTANPFAPTTQYIMEIDTTELFNSPLMVSKFITSVGGVLEFDPGINYRDSAVYYWRTSIVPGQNGQYHWNEFSFVYLPIGTPGFNQSHFYQHKQSNLDRITLDSASRNWIFGTIADNLYIKNGVFPTAAKNASDFTISINGNGDSIASACHIYELIFNIFDPVTFKPWLNANPGSSRFGSTTVCAVDRKYSFEYSIQDTASRRAILNFMDLIPDGSYVVVRNITGTNSASNTYPQDWIKDTSYLGSGNSIYYRLLSQGFTGIDSFNTPRAWIFTYQKNKPSHFNPQFVFSQGIFDKIFLSANYSSPDTIGTITSPLFGPAKQWKQLHWRGASLESPSTDNVTMQVIGVDTLGNQTPIYNLNLANQDFDISSINAKQFPYLQLKLTASDDINVTPYQLRYWRLNYVPVPEGALAPNIFVSLQDTIQLGQVLKFGIAFKNVSISDFDSMRINLSILDKNNVTHPIQLPRRKPLVSGDTLKLAYDLDISNYAGLNTLFLDVNPANDQPEEYHFNNFLYRNFYVKTDFLNPLLDVTFDNVHILNQDIVSAKPHIQIKLKDESKYLLLNDTSLITVRLRYPDGTLHPYNFNTDTVRFTPASSTADNTATVDFFPVFTKQYNPEGDDYQLIVTGKDKSGNPSGLVQYQVTFKIITKAMISNMLNYPNPFTTSTAFVFTITGSQIPQNIKIQILTITGKIVREITEDELGPLHVGRNITEFKWNGTDMYNQRLANGVYIYHVVTNLNGKSLDKYRAQGDNTDQFFTKGYGKMFLMR